MATESQIRQLYELLDLSEIAGFNISVGQLIDEAAEAGISFNTLLEQARNDDSVAAIDGLIREARREREAAATATSNREQARIDGNIELFFKTAEQFGFVPSDAQFDRVAGLVEGMISSGMNDPAIQGALTNLVPDVSEYLDEIERQGVDTGRLDTSRQLGGDTPSGNGSTTRLTPEIARFAFLNPIVQPGGTGDNIIVEIDDPEGRIDPLTEEVARVLWSVKNLDNFFGFDSPSGPGGGISAGESARLALDQARFGRDVFESDRNFERGVLESDRDFGRTVVVQDREFKFLTETDARDFEESVRRFGLELAEAQFQDRRDFAAEQANFQQTEGRLNRQLAAQTGLELGRLNVDMNEQIRQILRDPADFTARAFFSRGEDSPLPQITNADLINQLRTEFARIQNFANEQANANFAINPPPGPPPPVDNGSAGVPDVGDQGSSERKPPPVLPTPDEGAAEPSPDSARPDADPSRNVQPIPVRVEQPPAYVNEILYPGQTQADLQAIENRRIAAAGGQPFAMGGATTAPRLIVGDSPTGQPTGNEELIINPTGAPIHVVPNPGNVPAPRLALGTFGTVDEARNFLRNRPAGESYSSGVGQLPNTSASGTVNGPAGSITHPDGSTQLGNVSVSAGGDLGILANSRLNTGNVFGNIIDTSQVSQEQLIADADKILPPAIRSIFEDQMPARFRTKRSLFTPQQLASLTPDEQAALRSRLALDNESLDDYFFAQQRRFGSGRTGPRARLVVR